MGAGRRLVKQYSIKNSNQTANNGLLYTLGKLMQFKIHYKINTKLWGKKTKKKI